MGAIAMRIRARRARPAAQQMLDLIRRQGSGGAAFLPGVPLASGAHWLSGASSVPTPGVLGLDAITRPTIPWLAAYVESTASTPAAVDGPVGFLSDGEGTWGPELISNAGPFSNTAGWSVYTSCVLDTAGGNLRITNNNTNGAAQYAATTVSGAMYRYSVTNAGVAPFQCYDMTSGALLFTVNPGQTVQASLQATSTTGGLRIFVIGASGTVGLVGGVSMRPLTGRHATQNSGPNKPTMRKGFVNQTYYSQQIGNGAGWSTWNAGSITTTTAPDGSSTATQFTVTSGPGGRFQAGHAVTAGVPVTSMMIAKPVSGGSQLQLTVAANSAFGGAGGDRVLVIDGATGALVNKSAEVTGYSVEPMVGGYWLIVGNCTPTSTSSTDAIAAYGVATGQVLAAWMAGRTTGTLTAKQILAAGGIPLTTTIAASGTGGNFALEFDGTKQMGLSSVPFAASDDHAVVVGARVDDVAGQRTLYAHSNASNHQLPWIYYGTNGKINATYWDGTTTVTLTGPLAYTGQDVIVTLRRVGTTAVLRVNGQQVATASLAGMTSPALTAATLGGFNGGNLQHKGRIFGALPFKGVFSDAEVLVFERGLAALCPIPGALRF